MIVFPNAKINLGLNILSKRGDGFHDLESCFYPIQWKDALEILPTDNENISFSTSGISIPGVSSQNLVTRAYSQLKIDFDLPSVSIHLHKNIPLGAGLGGGSSDAAFALKILNSLFNLHLNDEQLAGYAARLGSDCPFFIFNRPMLAQGRGERLSTFDLELKGLHVVVVMPDIAVGTAEAYSWITPKKPRELLTEILKSPVDDWQGRLINDFEEPVTERFPVIGEIKKALINEGALYSAMSGSGAAVYGIFRQPPDTDRWRSFKHWRGQF